MTMNQRTKDLIKNGSHDLTKLWADYLTEALEEAGGNLDPERYAHSGDLVADFFLWVDVTLNQQ